MCGIEPFRLCNVSPSQIEYNRTSKDKIAIRNCYRENCYNIEKSMYTNSQVMFTDGKFTNTQLANILTAYLNRNL